MATTTNKTLGVSAGRRVPKRLNEHENALAGRQLLLEPLKPLHA